MSKLNEVMGAGTSGGAARAIIGTYGTVTAAGTSSQANGTALPYAINYVTTAGGADSVVLPTTAQGSQLGDEVKVFNLSSTSLNCYPGGSETANGSTSAIAVAQNKILTLTRVLTTGWGYSITA